MRRATDLPGYSYSTDKAVFILSDRYARIWQDVVTRKYFLRSEDGKNLLVVDEPGLIEIAQSVSYSDFFKANPIG